MKYIFLITLLPILFSCNKEKSQKWLVSDITVVDKYTGEPLECDLVLKWKTYSIGGGSSSHSIEIGETDLNGKFHIERKVSRKDGDFELEIWADYVHYGFPGVHNPQKVIQLSPSKKNEIVAHIPSKSYVVVSIDNVNCAGPTDTLFLRTVFGNDHNYLGYLEYVGCVDTILNEEQQYVGFLIYPTLELEYIVKRGAQVDTFNEVHTLTPKQFTNVNITY